MINYLHEKLLQVNQNYLHLPFPLKNHFYKGTELISEKRGIVWIDINFFTSYIYQKVH